MYLALDTASRQVSVALGSGDGDALVRQMAQTSSSKDLLPAIESLLREGNVELGGLAGLIAVRGPGSFTGIRIGLATVLGFHQALSIPATAFGTLELVSAAVGGPVTAHSEGTLDTDYWAAVWALRDEWYLQHFPAPGTGGAPSEPTRWSRARWLSRIPEGPCTVVGEGVEELVEPLGARGIALSTPPLAEVALGAARLRDDWNSALLTDPLYVQSPSVTLRRRAEDSRR